MGGWTREDAENLYAIDGWGQGLYVVDDSGHLCLQPDAANPDRRIDLKQLADDMRRRGFDLPLLVRFNDVIKHRVEGMVGAFTHAMKDWDYKGRYRPVFPIKVNPQSHVIRDVLTHGRAHHVGLEAGSKPELMVVLALQEDNDALIICNGYKDAQYIRMALLARRLGHEVVIVLEKPDELDLVLRVADELEVEPVIGFRAKLGAQGQGHWSTSSGDKAKFGLNITDMLQAVDKLRQADRLGCLQLLHFHIGSQIPEVRTFRSAIREGTRIYAELQRMGANMRFLDVGGGLGVDYDGSASTGPASINYDLHEYAQAVVGTIVDACAETGARHPDIITEAGRSMVAHHAVLLLDVLGSTTNETTPPERPKPGEQVPRQIESAWEIYDDLCEERVTENLHHIESLRRDAVTRFNLGLLTLEQRGYIERMYWATCTRALEIVEGDAEFDEDSEEKVALRQSLVDTYFCNFSVFQSAPDAWAIDQLFPISPVHRLLERPTRRIVLADLTCDSDGKITRFIGRRQPRTFLELHKLRRNERYVVGIFLVGAYQEILGDLHNLFGDTHAIHVRAADNKRGYTVEHLDEGDIIEEVLTYVHHNPKELVRKLREKVEAATESGAMDLEDGTELMRTFVKGLDEYTYLSR